MKTILEMEDVLQALYKCNQCGACASVCPLYRHTADESMCARGKLALIDALLAGKIKPGKRLSDRLYGCLLCRACSASCASGVPTTEIFLFARQVLSESGRLPWTYHIMLNYLLTGPRRFRLGVKTAAGLKHLPVLPKSWQLAKIRLSLAQGGGHRVESATPPASRGTVAYFLGCAVAGVFPNIVRATARVLVQNGWQPVILSNSCCGMPYQAYGLKESARRLARKNIDLLGGYGAVVTDCATCGSTLKDYGNLLAVDAAYNKKALDFSAKVRDISEFLIERGLSPPAPAVVKKEITVAYHDPCHLARGQGVRRQPRSILEAIPGVQLKEMDNPETCCGGSGFFPIAYPQLSGRVGQDKVEAILSTGAGVVSSGCPGCLMQLGLALQKENRGVRAAHPVELLAEAYHR